MNNEKRIKQLEEKVDALISRIIHKELKEEFCMDCVIKETVKNLTEEPPLYPTEECLGWWISEKGIITITSSVSNGTVLESMIKCFENNNWFPTKEAAEKELEKRQAIARLKKYAIDNDLDIKIKYIIEADNRITNALQNNCEEDYELIYNQYD